MGNRFENIERGMEAQGRDIAEMQEHKFERDSRLFPQTAKEATGESDGLRMEIEKKQYTSLGSTRGLRHTSL